MKATTWVYYVETTSHKTWFAAKTKRFALDNARHLAGLYREAGVGYQIVNACIGQRVTIEAWPSPHDVKG